MTAPEDIHAEVLGHLATAIREHQFGVTYGYAATWAPAQVQGPAGPVQGQMWTLLITRRSPLLGGDDLHHMAQIFAGRPKREQIDQQVAEGIRLLAALFEQLRKPPAAPPAGPAAVSPLVLANGRRRG
jgi:hypothetical protein